MCSLSVYWIIWETTDAKSGQSGHLNIFNVCKYSLCWLSIFGSVFKAALCMTSWVSTVVRKSWMKIKWILLKPVPLLVSFYSYDRWQQRQKMKMGGTQEKLPFFTSRLKYILYFIRHKHHFLWSYKCFASHHATRVFFKCVCAWWHYVLKLVNNLFILCICVFSVLSNMWPGEDDAAGTVRQLQWPRSECQWVWPRRSSYHRAGLCYVSMPVPLQWVPPFPVLTKHQHQEQPSPQPITPMADWSLGRGEASHMQQHHIKVVHFRRAKLFMKFGA